MSLLKTRLDIILTVALFRLFGTNHSEYRVVLYDLYIKKKNREVDRSVRSPVERNRSKNREPTAESQMDKGFHFPGRILDRFNRSSQVQLSSNEEEIIRNYMQTILLVLQSLRASSIV